MISMLRACRPSDTDDRGRCRRPAPAPPACTPCSRSSAASITPVGPPPTMITSNMNRPFARTSGLAAGDPGTGADSAAAPGSCRKTPLRYTLKWGNPRPRILTRDQTGPRLGACPSSRRPTSPLCAPRWTTPRCGTSSRRSPRCTGSPSAATGSCGGCAPATSTASASSATRAGPAFLNLSVWRDCESLHAFVYRSAHGRQLLRRDRWFDRAPQPSTVLWWVADGAQPTAADATRRLAHLRAHGPTPRAFSLRRRFSASGTPLTGGRRAGSRPAR